MTALVYWQLHSSLYTGAVQGCWSTPHWSDRCQSCRQVPTGLPLSSGLGWEKKRSEVQPLWRCLWRDRYRVCGTWDDATGPGHAKTSSLGRKTVPGPSRGGAKEWEGQETSGSENETCLVAARPPGREPCGLPWRRGLPACECDCTIVKCTIQRVQPDWGHHCGSKHNKRYDSTGLLTVT